jgi:hypothetical protein
VVTKGTSICSLGYDEVIGIAMRETKHLREIVHRRNSLLWLYTRPYGWNWKGGSGKQDAGKRLGCWDARQATDEAVAVEDRGVGVRRGP